MLIEFLEYHYAVSVSMEVMAVMALQYNFRVLNQRLATG
jgi:formyltetrahydrofolate synthetase